MELCRKLGSHSRITGGRSNSKSGGMHLEID
jgi:hypothetical protein